MLLNRKLINAIDPFSHIGKVSLQRFLTLNKLLKLDESHWNAINILWADNGDWLSKIYAGTGALKSYYTRGGKQSVFGFLDDAAKAAQRFYLNNFQDKPRQEAIDLLLGKGPKPESLIRKSFLSEMVHNELKVRESEYCTFADAFLYAGTWNVNGKNSASEILDSWIFSKAVGFPNLYVIGIQELIELTPGAYITADTDKLRLFWEQFLLNAINAKDTQQYVVLRSAHLVALGLFIFVKHDCIKAIRNVEVARIKTGLGGMAANKGGIGISLNYHDTSIVFITAHFAAGTSAVNERNADFHTITNGLQFRSKSVTDHEYFISQTDC